ncbi:uncharacterized protein LACBIDRAFT_331817 [Laccaria bicolor S238N-H82]|uniref:Predicted protein n=1 Tax=Laccaria bicolor (strain S238N-H82 / ATCC MYA-4686) TaxID=486041 RepID=B0DQP0_LACBS|nr:uncharacterized protein LACBIDRAFT_331817 [Laccaria bicolor S238N-H82]EDR03148.1 predicted protein [Laccaria bicolor S238N-H82]|eukprot:XP_001886289.1 predicted protein [Laccaria bicolor S238N-H82]
MSSLNRNTKQSLRRLKVMMKTWVWMNNMQNLMSLNLIEINKSMHYWIPVDSGRNPVEFQESYQNFRNATGIPGILLEFQESYWNSRNPTGIPGILLEFQESYWNFRNQWRNGKYCASHTTTRLNAKFSIKTVDNYPTYSTLCHALNLNTTPRTQHYATRSTLRDTLGITRRAQHYAMPRDI